MTKNAKTPDWVRDEYVVVTSGSIEEIVEILHEDEETMYVWLKVLSQLRPTPEMSFPVDLSRDDMVHAEVLVGLKLLRRDAEDIDRYWVDSKVAYADLASNVLHKDLN